MQMKEIFNMNLQVKFEDEVCVTCDVYNDCDCGLEHQAQCAILGIFFKTKSTYLDVRNIKNKME